jgi:hypothetical protein
MWRYVAVALLALSLGSSIALAEDMKLPPLKKQPTPQAVIDEHMDALNKCDWNRLMAQYPADYQLTVICRTVWSSKAERWRPRFSQTS